MWYDTENRDKIMTGSSLITAIKQETEKKVFILDGRSGCGKTYIANHFSAKRILRIPSHLIKECIFYTNDVRSNAEMLSYFLSMLPVDFVFLEDIDDPFGKPFETTQKILAYIGKCLSKSYKVILTGIELTQSCCIFLEMLNDQYRFYMFTD